MNKSNDVPIKMPPRQYGLVVLVSLLVAGLLSH